MSKYSSTILVTGGTVGIGYEAATVLARTFPELQIVIASRSDKTSAAASINQSLGQSNVAYISLDLSSRAGARDFVPRYVAQFPQPISALLLNAGIQIMSGTELNVDGVEKTYGTNHVGHALLLFLLAPHLSPDARILVTASGTHDPKQGWKMPDPDLRGPEILAHPDEQLRAKGGQTYYTSSKLANVEYTYVLNRRFQELGKAWTINAFDPGLTPGTGLMRTAPAPIKFVVKHVLPRLLGLLKVAFGNQNVHTPVEAGTNMAALITAAKLKGVTGKYYEGEFEDVPSSAASYEVGRQEKLWHWTLDFVAQNEQEKQKFARFA